MSAPSYFHRHRVTYADCTVGNHVYYSRYLDFLESARGEFFRSLGFNFLELQQRDFIFPVIHCQLQFKAPARYDDELRIEVWLTELGRIKLSFGYRILNAAGTLLVAGGTGHVCTSSHEKPKRLATEIVQALQPHLRAEH